MNYELRIKAEALTNNSQFAIRDSRFSRGFTIVELLVVIGIIIVLMGIVTTAASESMKASRSRRADALISLVQAGVAAYYAQNDEWPISFKGKSGNHKTGANDVDENQYDLSDSEVGDCVRKIVESAKEGNPLIDVSGLWVADKSKYTDGSGKRTTGMDFMTAIHGSRKSSKKLKLENMVFGYPATSNGAFTRFGMGYSISTDQLTVGRREDYLGSGR